jgi:hypothetical protein
MFSSTRPPLVHSGGGILLQSGITYTSSIHGRKIMEEKKAFEDPEVTSYDRDELDLNIALTGRDDGSDPAQK